MQTRNARGRRALRLLAFVGTFNFAMPMASEASDDVTAKQYQTHCATCHGVDRLGVMGPALLADNLSRLAKSEAAKIVRDGRASTQMAGFAAVLSSQQISAMVDWIYAEPITPPEWRELQIVQSHRSWNAPQKVRSPVADPLNLFVVVEAGDHHVAILDGDALEPVTRFASRFALHGGAKFSPDGRYTYLASRDGWVSKYDLWALQTVAEIRVGINTRNIAVSPDGRFVLAGNMLPANLVVLDADTLKLRQVIPVETPVGRSRVSAVYAAKPRGSFIVALKDLPEVWELPIPNSDKPPFYVLAAANEALRRSANAVPVRRLALPAVLDDLFFSPGLTQVVGASRNGNAFVIDLDNGAQVAELALKGMPHLASGISWRQGDRQLAASPNLREAAISVFDVAGWQPVTTIATPGPGFFLRTHEHSAYLWADVFLGRDKDAMLVIDKQSLRVAATLRPAPGKTAAHVEFDRYGKYALVSIWENDGALVVYDAATLAEVKRIPMRKPVGKYNVYNKISGAEGTSP